MGDTVWMDVMQSPDQLLSHLPDLWLLQILIIFDDIEKLTLTQLCDDYKLWIGFKRV